MKKTNISFQYDEDKLNAVKMFLEQKNVDLDEELEAFMESIYKKYVPAGVRDYIEMMEEQTGREKEKKKTAKSPQPVPPQPGMMPGGGEQG